MEELKEDFKQLELAFRNSTFRLDSIELQIFKEARNISSEIYKSRMTLSSGVLGLRRILENAFGVDKVEVCWEQTIFFFLSTLIFDIQDNQQDFLVQTCCIFCQEEICSPSFVLNCLQDGVLYD